MPSYTVTVKTDAARITSVQKALKKAFGEDAPIYTVEKVTTPESRSARLAEAESMVQDAASIVEELKDEMEQWRDSIPENLQGGGKYDEVSDTCDALDTLHSELESADFGSVEFPGMF